MMGIEIVLDPITKIPGDEMGTAISARCMETGLSCNVVQLKGMGVSFDLSVCHADIRGLSASPLLSPSRRTSCERESRLWMMLLRLFSSNGPEKRPSRVRPRPLSCECLSTMQDYYTA